MEMHQVLNERDLLIAVFGKILRDKTFMNSIYMLQMDRLQLTPDGECKHQHLKSPVFALQKCAVYDYRAELTITAYSLLTSAQLD